MPTGIISQPSRILRQVVLRDELLLGELSNKALSPPQKI